MGTLHVVSTPIGNLGDLSPRAEETLRTVSRILAEDTRRTRILAGSDWPEGSGIQTSSTAWSAYLP